MSDPRRVVEEDDFKIFSPAHLLPNGSIVHVVQHDGCIRLVLWGKDENPSTDEPWIIASVDPDGIIETYGDIPGQEMKHVDGDSLP